MPGDQDSLSSLDLRVLFGTNASASERLKTLTDFATVVRSRMQSVASAASAGALTVTSACPRLA